MLHYKTIKGIVDRDRRTEGEINSLLQDKIYVPCQNTIDNVCNQSTQTIDDYKTSLDEIVDKVKPQEEYSKACKELQKIVDDKDYLAALRVINNKGLLPFTNVSNAFGWKKQNYIDYVIRLLGIQDSTSEELCNIFGNYVTVGD